jgi:hypothetical protein
MDNDNKIIPPKNTVGLFLDNMDVRAVSEKQEYNLEEQFISSKKNKNWRVLIILSVLVVFLVSASWGLTRWIEARNTISNFELDEFQDVDFMDILNEVQKVEQQLSTAENELVTLRTDYQKARQSVNLNADQDLKLLASRDISEAGLARGRRDIAARRDQELQAVDDEYLDQIAMKEEEIAVIREKMAAYDSDKIRQAQEYESVLANEQQKYELEKQQIIDSYEKRLADQEAEFQARMEEVTGFQQDLESVLVTASEGRQVKLVDLFNPDIPEDRTDLAELANAPIEEDRLAYNMPDTDPRWIEQGYISKEELEALDQSVGNWRELMEFLSSIPFRNDMPKVLKQLEYRYLNMIDLLEQKESATFETLSKKERELTALSSKIGTMVPEEYKDFYEWTSYSLSLRLKDLGGQGIMMEPGVKGRLLAFMDPFLDLPSGETGFVYGLDNEYIGTVKLEKTELFYTVEVIELDEGRQFKAFDRIFLKTKNLTDKENNNE